MDKKPNVIPTQQQIQSLEEEKRKIEAYEAEKSKVTSEIYNSSMAPSDTPEGHVNAVELMRKRTEFQMSQKKESGVVKDNSLAEKPTGRVVTQTKNDDLLKARDEQLAKNKQQTENYQKMSEEAMNRHYNTSNNMQNNYSNNSEPSQISTPVITQPRVESYFNMQPTIDPYILELSQPNYNAPFDVIPLPSKGRFYKNKKESVRVAYMTTADENILTSPNLLQSGEFLEILINRKILEPTLRYKDLLPGDRNAIMIWLRATAYGELYPVTLFDEVNEPFEAEINLNDLKTVELSVEPDEEGLYLFQLPSTKAFIKFKLLTCGDIDSIEKIVEKEKEMNIPVNNLNTYKLEKMIVEVNGSRDRTMIRDIANSMRIPDARAFNEYIDSIDCGIDLNINVVTPGGESLATFLPLNLSFFWPDLRV